MKGPEGAPAPDPNIPPQPGDTGEVRIPEAQPPRVPEDLHAYGNPDDTQEIPALYGTHYPVRKETYLHEDNRNFNVGPRRFGSGFIARAADTRPGAKLGAANWGSPDPVTVEVPDSVAYIAGGSPSNVRDPRTGEEVGHQRRQVMTRRGLRSVAVRTGDQREYYLASGQGTLKMGQAHGQGPSHGTRLRRHNRDLRHVPDKQHERLNKGINKTIVYAGVAAVGLYVGSKLLPGPTDWLHDRGRDFAEYYHSTPVGERVNKPGEILTVLGATALAGVALYAEAIDPRSKLRPAGRAMKMGTVKSVKGTGSGIARGYRATAASRPVTGLKGMAQDVKANLRDVKESFRRKPKTDKNSDDKS